jgi:uncharacterized protein
MRRPAANFVEKVVNARSGLIRVEAEENDSTTSGRSVGATGAATSLPANRRDLRIEIDGDGSQTITLANPATTGAEIAAALQTAIRALTPQHASTPAAAFSAATATFDDGRYTIASGSTGRRSSVEVTDAPTDNAAALLRLGRTNGGGEVGGAAVLRPVAGTDYHLGDHAVGGAVASVVAGSDGQTPQDTDYIAALTRLDPVRDVNLLAVPGIGTAAVFAQASSYCANRQDCFFIGDMDVTDDTKEEAQDFVNGLTFKTSHAAAYYPWLRALDPSGESPEPIALPPSGYVAGIYARTDARRGIWKAPAGNDANVAGVVGLVADTTDAEQDTLNPIGVNVIRSFPAAGIVVWGARTVATQSDPEYRYVPVRRTAIFIQQSIRNGIQWAVFEPNDEDLWSSLRLNIGAFMTRLFRAGAFQGATPSQAFFVKCDGQTTTQADIDAGVVNILVAFAPLKPAEFVVLKISQKAGQQT